MADRVVTMSFTSSDPVAFPGSLAPGDWVVLERATFGGVVSDLRLENVNGIAEYAGESLPEGAPGALWKITSVEGTVNVVPYFYESGTVAAKFAVYSLPDGVEATSHRESSIGELTGSSTAWENPATRCVMARVINIWTDDTTTVEITSSADLVASLSSASDWQRSYHYIYDRSYATTPTDGFSWVATSDANLQLNVLTVILAWTPMVTLASDPNNAAPVGINRVPVIVPPS